VYQLAGYQDIRASENKMRNSDKKQDYGQEKGIAGFEKLWVWQKSHQLMIEMH
jgi:hypothetical protein